AAMATLTVRNLDDDVVRRPRIRAAEHGRSAEAEHREILRLVLIGDEADQAEQRQRVAERLANSAGEPGDADRPPRPSSLKTCAPKEPRRGRDRIRPADYGARGRCVGWAQMDSAGVGQPFGGSARSERTRPACPRLLAERSNQCPMAASAQKPVHA